MNLRDAICERADLFRVGMTGGRGFGHVSATHALVEALRTAGFATPIELVAPKQVRMKAERMFETLLSRESAAGRSVRFVDEEEIARDETAWGLVAACDDERSWLDTLGVERCVVLQPYDWPAPRMIQTRAGARDLDLPRNSAFVFEPAPAKPQLDSVRALIERVVRGEWRLMPVYGLHHPAVGARAGRVVDNLVAALRRHQEAGDRRPSVVLLFHESLPGVSSTALDAVSNVAPGEVAVVTAGTVSQADFRACLSAADLPIVYEGANTANFVHLLGKPFLSVFSGLTDIPEIDGEEEGWRTVERASKALLRDGRGSTFDSVIVDSPQPQFRTMLADLLGAANISVRTEGEALRLVDLTSPTPERLGVVQAHPSVVLVSEDDPKTMVASLDAGALDYLPMPHSPERVAHMVARVLDDSDPIDDIQGALTEFDDGSAARSYYDAVGRNLRDPARDQVLHGLRALLDA